MTVHAMIDLETLSVKPNAAILTIGGVKFNPYNNIEPSQGLYHRIDEKESLSVTQMNHKTRSDSN